VYLRIFFLFCVIFVPFLNLYRSLEKSISFLRFMGDMLKLNYYAFNRFHDVAVLASWAFKKFKVGMKIWICSAFGIANKQGKLLFECASS
jgi:hypothetical protein